MTEEQLNKALARLCRLSLKTEEKSGIGFIDVYEDENENLHLHEVKGVKSIDEFEDELLNGLTWAWNMKDYIKEVLKSQGKDPQTIEEQINSSQTLCLLSDLANGTKHGKLRKSRSGYFACLGKVTMSIPQIALSKITFEARRIETEINDSSEVEFSAPVISNEGVTLGDAGVILSESLKIWESLSIFSGEDHARKDSRPSVKR